MTCADVLANISAYHDGELPLAEQEPIAAHLAECPACRAVLGDLSQIGELLRAGSAGEVSDGLWDRIAVAALRTPPARRLRARAWYLRLTAAAAGLVLYLCGYGLITSAPEPPAELHTGADAPVELALRDTGAAFAGSGLLGEPARLFAQRPEARLFTELTKDVGP